MLNGSIKAMLLGIAFMLVGIFIQNEPGIKIQGYELYVVGIGFLLTVIALFWQDNPDK